MDATTLIHQFPYFGLFALLVLGVIGFPFPEDAILILCGFLISTGAVQPIHALLVVGFGMLITDFSLYHVGRKYGRKVVFHKRFHKIINAKRIVRLEKIFRKWGPLVIFLGRHLVGLRSQIFLVAGILKMPRTKFILADAVSSVVTLTIMVGAGYWGASTIELIKKDMEEARFALLGLIGFIILGVVIWQIAVRRFGDENDQR